MAVTTDRGLWREAIRITLAHRAGDAPDASAIAEATISTWSQVSVLLIPVIGMQGVDAIFRRSLYISRISFSWLVFGEEQKESAALLVTLKARLAGRDADDAAEAGYTLLLNFIELLITLIGESLTERMLSPVWAFPASASEQEMAP
jgi:hypothetical protein